MTHSPGLRFLNRRSFPTSKLTHTLTCQTNLFLNDRNPFKMFLTSLRTDLPGSENMNSSSAQCLVLERSSFTTTLHHSWAFHRPHQASLVLYTNPQTYLKFSFKSQTPEDSPTPTPAPRHIGAASRQDLTISKSVPWFEPLLSYRGF